MWTFQSLDRDEKQQYLVSFYSTFLDSSTTASVQQAFGERIDRLTRLNESPEMHDKLNKIYDRISYYERSNKAKLIVQYQMRNSSNRHEDDTAVDCEAYLDRELSKV